MAGPWDSPPTDAEKANVWSAPPRPEEAVAAKAPARPTSPEVPSALGSIGRGFAQGATLGFGDEVGGAVPALAQLLGLGKETDRGGRPLSVGDVYREYRDAERAKNEAARGAHPWLYGGSQLGGGIVGTVPFAAVAPLAGLSLGQKALALGRTAGGVGALGGLGFSEADPSISPVRTISDFLGGGVVGTALPLAGNYLAEAAAPALRSLAVSRAVEALGTKLGQYKNLAYQDAIQPLGEWLMDNGLIPWSGSAKTIQARVGAKVAQGITQDVPAAIQALDQRAAEMHGRAIKEAIGNLNGTTQPQAGLVPLSDIQPALEKTPMAQWAVPAGAEASSVTNAGGFAPEITASSAAPAGAGSLPQPYLRLPVVRQAATEQILNPLSKLPPTSRPVSPAAIQAEIDGLRTPLDRMRFAESNNALHGLDERTGSYGQEEGPLAERLKQLRGMLRSEQQSAAERVDPDLAAQLLSAKSNLGNASKAKEIIDATVLRNLANRNISPSDYGTALTVGAGAMAHGGPTLGSLLLGLMGGAINHIGRKSGNAMSANMAQLLSQAMENPTLGKLATAGASSSLGGSLPPYLYQLFGSGAAQR